MGDTILAPSHFPASAFCRQSPASTGKARTSTTMAMPASVSRYRSAARPSSGRTNGRSRPLPVSRGPVEPRSSGKSLDGTKWCVAVILGRRRVERGLRGSKPESKRFSGSAVRKPCGRNGLAIREICCQLTTGGSRHADRAFYLARVRRVVFGGVPARPQGSGFRIAVRAVSLRVRRDVVGWSVRAQRRRR
jgi:hypothetical protein